MIERLNLMGAMTALVIFLSSIITFSVRMIFKTEPGHWIGLPMLLCAFPLAFLLIKGPEANRQLLYYLQSGLMLAWIILLFIVDYVVKYDFRQTQWMVISYVMLYFAGIGGMIGIASLAGRNWSIASVILFFISTVLAFVQRAVTGF